MAFEELSYPVSDIAFDLVEWERCELEFVTQLVHRAGNIFGRVDEGAIEVEDDEFHGHILAFGCSPAPRTKSDALDWRTT